MKKIFIIASAALVFHASTAQKIDRSQKPKAGPAPVITIKDPVKYTLPNGITILVVENHTLPKVSAGFSIDAGPIKEGSKTGVLGLLGGMLNEGTTKKSKAEFDEAVDQMGADVNLSSGGGAASALTRYFEKAFMLMAEGMRYPAFAQSSFDKLKAQSLTGLKANERSAKAISGRVVGALTYGKESPFGEFETEESLNSITLADVKEAYSKYVTPSRGYLTFVGDIKPEAAKALAMKAFGDWKGATLTLPTVANVGNPAKTEVNLVDVPNAVQSEITVTNLVNLPMSSPDYFAVLLANNILGGGSESRLFMNLREKHAFTYGSYSSISASRYQSTFSATASVRNEKADSAVGEILSEIKRMRDTKVSDEELKNAKALYNGTFALGMENTGRIATFATNILLYNLPKDFYRTYLQKINAVTADDIQRVSQKYFNYSNTRVVIVGKAETVQVGLAKLGYAVNQYDKYANPVTATAAKATNVSATDVVNNYIKAVGGEAAIKKVSTVLMNMDMSVRGMTLDAVQKAMNPNKEMTEVSKGGNVVMKDMFNGETGYQMQMGQKRDMDAKDIADKKAKKNIVDQLNYKEPGYKLEMKGIEKVNGKDAYKILVTSPSGKATTEYYDVNTAFLLKQETSSVASGMDLSQTVQFDNYTKVNDVLFPFAITLTVEVGGNSTDIAYKVKSVKINEGVSADDFK
jgi:predicted Zn-dependent peptidase